MAMKCPHCEHAIHETTRSLSLGFGSDSAGFHAVEAAKCPADGCQRYIVWLVNHDGQRTLIYPSAQPARPPAPAEVPEAIRSDYDEAAAVLPVSAKASAALSRRCLQHVLRDAGGVTASTLFKEIQEVLDAGRLPSELADNLDYVRVVGNFSAHPEKDQMGIVDVETGEAEWTLDVLDGLFDHFYVKPAIAPRSGKPSKPRRARRCEAPSPARGAC